MHSLETIPLIREVLRKKMTWVIREWSPPEASRLVFPEPVEVVRDFRLRCQAGAWRSRERSPTTEASADSEAKNRLLLHFQVQLAIHIFEFGLLRRYVHANEIRNRQVIRLNQVIQITFTIFCNFDAFRIEFNPL